MLSRLPVVLMLAASLSVFHPGLVNAAGPAKPGNDKPATEKVEVQEKFIWGIVVNLVLSSVFSMFTDWLGKKLGTDVSGGKPLTLPNFGDAAAAAPTPVASVGDIKAQLVNVAVVAVTGILTNKLNSVLTTAFLGKDVPTTAKPKAALQVKDGDPNYQAAHIAILAVDTAGNVTGFRSVRDGFRTGERFKVRVISTYDALVALGNINPSGKERQIYPPGTNTVISIKAGTEVVLPLAADQYFQFTGETGTDQLVVTVIDPRALEGKPSKKRVHRQDVDYGSNFAQEVTPDTYPVISQPIALLHQ
jgi:hypothetical protein